VTRCAVLLLIALAADTPTIDPIHLRLLRQAVVVWMPFEAGGPGVAASPLMADDPDSANDAARADIAARAGLKVGARFTDDDRQKVDALRSGLPAALVLFIERATLAPGTYPYRDPAPADPTAPRAEPAEPPVLAFTADHQTLLKALRWEGMYVDLKRPYGEQMYFELEMAEWLGESVKRDKVGRPDFTPAQRARYERLHREMQPALQVFLENARLP